MSLFPKLEVAIDHGTVLLIETIALVKQARTLLTALEPTVAELPATLTEARAVMAQLGGSGRQGLR